MALFASAGLEAAWALALSESKGFTIPLWTIVFLVCCTMSMIGLGFAMRGIPISVAYAIWTGTGAALTVTIAMLLGTEPVSVLKIVFLGGIVACVVGLKFTGSHDPHRESSPDANAEHSAVS